MKEFGCSERVAMSFFSKCIRFLKNYGVKEFLYRFLEWREKKEFPYSFWRKKNCLNRKKRKKYRNGVKKQPNLPQITVIYSLKSSDRKCVNKVLNSIRNQIYQNWNCIVVYGKEGYETMPSYYHEKNEFFYITKELKVSDIRQVSVNTKYILYVDEDAILEEDTLVHLVNKFEREKDLDIVYFDNDIYDYKRNTYSMPKFKSNIDVVRLKSQNYIGKTIGIRLSCFRALSGNFDFSAEDKIYRFLLWCCDNSKRIGHIPRMLVHSTKQDDTNYGDSLKNYFEEKNERVVIQKISEANSYHIKYKDYQKGKVSIIIPNKDHVDSLKICLDSIMESSYEDYEVIVVENNSTEDETFEYYMGIQEQYPQKIRVVEWQENGFNYSALNNFGRRYATGEYLVLLNNDIQIVTKNWLEEMLSNCSHNNVGVVGARLLYPDNTIQHAGIVVGIGGRIRGVASNMLVGVDKTDSKWEKSLIDASFSAVTAACMMVKTSVYDSVGGFTEKLAVAFNDVDFCLKARELGIGVMYDAQVLAYHYESKSRGKEDTPEKRARFQKEVEYMRTVWKKYYQYGDPFYNKNLSLVRDDYAVSRVKNNEDMETIEGMWN